LLLRGDEWKVYDVKVEGISLVTNYRSTYATEVQKNGLDALITRIENHK
jgi:phospholipid transport system substrate-binding protein